VSTPVVLGLDFGGTKVAAAVAEVSGDRIGETTVETDPSRGARWNLDCSLEAACVLIDAVAPGRELAAVGACTFGIPAASGVGLAPAIPGWEELALGHELEVMFDCAVVRLATDVKAAAAAEVASGALTGHDPAIYVNLGTGLAVAIVFDGKIVSGANGAAGEIGYNLRQLSDVDLERSEQVVLEEVVSGMGLSVSGRRRTGREMTAADVFAGAASDRRLSEVTDQFIRELSFHLVNLAVALDPARIAVGGGMVRAWEVLEPPLRRALDNAVPFPPELVIGAYPFDAALVGALNLARGAVLERSGPGAPAAALAKADHHANHGAERDSERRAESSADAAERRADTSPDAAERRADTSPDAAERRADTSADAAATHGAERNVDSDPDKVADSIARSPTAGSLATGNVTSERAR
jgi:glucokinase